VGVVQEVVPKERRLTVMIHGEKETEHYQFHSIILSGTMLAAIDIGWIALTEARVR